FYAFFPLWPLVLRSSGSIPDWAAALAVVVAASGLAFLGVAASNPSGQARRAALALACWPGSFLLLLAYPDVLALAASSWAAVLVPRGPPFPARAAARAPARSPREPPSLLGGPYSSLFGAGAPVPSPSPIPRGWGSGPGTAGAASRS